MRLRYLKNDENWEAAMAFFSLLEPENAKTSSKGDRSKTSVSVRMANFMRDNPEKAEIIKRAMKQDWHHPIQIECEPESSDNKTSEAQNRQDRRLTRRTEKEIT